MKMPYLAKVHLPYASEDDIVLVTSTLEHSLTVRCLSIGKNSVCYRNADVVTPFQDGDSYIMEGRHVFSPRIEFRPYLCFDAQGNLYLVPEGTVSLAICVQPIDDTGAPFKGSRRMLTAEEILVAPEGFKFKLQQHNVLPRTR